MGAFSYSGPDAETAERVLSQCKRIARASYSNPPVHGARIVAEVVGDEATFNEWRKEMEGMANRIKVCPPSMLEDKYQGLDAGVYAETDSRHIR